MPKKTQSNVSLFMLEQYAIFTQQSSRLYYIEHVVWLSTRTICHYLSARIVCCFLV